ncbi:3cbc031c-96a8-4f74-8c6d-ee1a113f8112 [Sclerotinia trifoliorum]|uniref:3cbc031c-96a8-4f74-8c6d-ee1a113f8112 n=1 Tax=Sclerotinia trifoliorum TaxID=28548 RepID=A0A8H2VZC1_9HELO|nr:3cbc031c-96a8-4f74-8c6d-ee1a113f8112 [Sclerotinia trifoliorum]
MPPVKPLIYAELLSNIRQISILAFLDTPSDSSTKVELLADGTILRLYHAEENIQLTLPGQVVSNLELRKFPIGSVELSWRLPLVGDFQRADADISQTIEAPWSAKDMANGAQIFECRKCFATIVAAGRIKEWKDLPSEGWAEMMDFWHCHKPWDHAGHNHGEENLASTKGYGANAKFTAQAGIGFVDHSTFLLAENDCNIPVGGKEVKRPIHCENGRCLATIGYSDPQNEGVRVFKWSLRMGTFEESPSSSLSNMVLEPSMAKIISAQFLGIMNSSCVSRLLLLPSTTSENGPVYPGLSIWVFNPSIRFTALNFHFSRKMHISETAGRPGILAMKILWKPCAPIRDPSSENESVEELELPGDMLHGFRHHLEDVTKRYLPPSARKLQDWNVSLLERYEAAVKEE